LRLVAGPLNDAAAAAKICAAMSEKDRDCQTAVFNGQRLTFQPDDAPAAAKPGAPAVTRQRNASQKRAAAELSAKKPEAATTSGWSPFLGKKN
jgi:hypothetical protein